MPNVPATSGGCDANTVQSVREQLATILCPGGPKQQTTTDTRDPPLVPKLELLALISACRARVYQCIKSAYPAHYRLHVVEDYSHESDIPHTGTASFCLNSYQITSSKYQGNSTRFQLCPRLGMRKLSKIAELPPTTQMNFSVSEYVYAASYEIWLERHHWHRYAYRQTD